MQQRESGAINIGNGLKPEYTRTAASIMMLQILYSRDIVSVSELANLLQTNPRNIPEYKKELQYAGYLIDSVPGRYGGYRLVKQALFPSIKLDKSEIKALSQSVEFLLTKKDFLERDNFLSAMNKVMSAVGGSEEAMGFTVINQHGLTMPFEELQKRYYAILHCINNRLVLNMDFLSSDNVTRNRNIYPYKLFIYNQAWFVIGYCERAGAIRFFKLTRIENFKVTDRRFRKPSKFVFKESDYFDKYGFKVGMDWTKLPAEETQMWHHVKLMMHGRPAMYVREFVYGRNQVVTPIDKDNTLLECEVQYRYNVIKLVLGFGSDCDIIEPDWLKTEVLEIVTKMKESLEAQKSSTETTE